MKFRAIWIPRFIAAAGIGCFVAGTFWMFVSGRMPPSELMTWGGSAALFGILLLLLAEFASKKAPIPREAETPGAVSIVRTEKVKS
jgi:hypothetical protein